MTNMEHSCNFLSHPGICLKDHLKEVGERCRRKAIEIGIKDDNLLGVIEITGKFHDIGKYSKFFQDYLLYQIIGNKELARHSALSALFSGWIVSKIFRDPFLSAASFYSVYRHHGNLDDSLYSVFSSDTIKEVVSQCKRQLISFEKREDISHEVDELLRSLNVKEVNLSFKDFVEDYKNYLPTLKKAASDFVLKYESKNIFKDFYKVCLIFSLLIDFDKKIAGKVYADKKVKYSYRVSSTLVDTYVKRLRVKDTNDPMDEIREGIRKNTLERFQELTSSSTEIPKIMTITAPTGSGKTLLSLLVATRIRELNGEAKPKIIYVLPYINIVEQTYDVFKNVFDSDDIGLLLKHHHKAYSLTSKIGEDISIEDILLLAESWDSEVIVTTSVQFFETLLGWRNRMLKKFNELFNSVIIFDEIQTLPIEYWRLLKEALENLIEYSNSHLIYMSATRPIIFKGQELVRDYEKYFRKLERVRFNYIPRDMTIDEAVRFVFDKWKLKGSLLVVLNTIKSSIEFYEKFKQLLLQEGIKMSILSEGNERIDENSLIVSYLSTNVIPLHRLKRIKRIKELLKLSKTVILISTQTVEAGVDLDFDMAVRDIGPFDSIVQVAGRCNRNAVRKKGAFYILRLVDEEGRRYAERVYGKLSIGVSEKILDEHKEFDESEIFDMINDYYEETNRVFGERSDEYDEIIERIEKLDFGGLKGFKIIKEEPKYSVFIEYDENARRIKYEFSRFLEERRQADKDRIYEISAKIRIARSKLENYMIETWSDVGNLPILNGYSDIRYVGPEEVERWYNRETGLNIEETEPIFL